MRTTKYCTSTRNKGYLHMSQTSKPRIFTARSRFSLRGIWLSCCVFRVQSCCCLPQDSITRVMSSGIGWQFRLQHRAGDLMSCEVCVFTSGVVQGRSCQTRSTMLGAQGYMTCSSHEIMSRTVATVGFITKFLLRNCRSFQTIFSTGPCKQAEWEWGRAFSTEFFVVAAVEELYCCWFTQ